MKVFLTSATGFIGAQIATQLVSRGDTVGAGFQYSSHVHFITRFYLLVVPLGDQYDG